jgi:hypothetical protein
MQVKRKFWLTVILSAVTALLIAIALGAGTKTYVRLVFWFLVFYVPLASELHIYLQRDDALTFTGYLRYFFRRQLDFSRLTKVLMAFTLAIIIYFSYACDISLWASARTYIGLAVRIASRLPYIEVTDNVIVEQVMDAAVRPETQKQLVRLFKKDIKIDYAELGGCVTLTPEGDLKFYEMPSSCNWLYFDMRGCADWKDTLEFIRRREWVISSTIDDSWFHSRSLDWYLFILENPNHSDQTKEICARMFRDFFKTDVLNCRYMPNMNGCYKFFAEKPWREKFIGGFHLHPGFPNGPSEADISSSSMLRQTLIEPYLSLDMYDFWVFEDVPVGYDRSKLPRITVKVTVPKE